MSPVDDVLFARLRLVDIDRDFARNIISLRESQDLFDDLSNDPADRLLAQQVEIDIIPSGSHRAAHGLPDGIVSVEKQAGKTWLELNLATL